MVSGAYQPWHTYTDHSFFKVFCIPPQEFLLDEIVGVKRSAAKPTCAMFSSIDQSEAPKKKGFCHLFLNNMDFEVKRPEFKSCRCH
jgi:hypothetical protein